MGLVVIPYMRLRASPGQKAVVPRLSATGRYGTKKRIRVVSRELMNNDESDRKKRDEGYVLRGARRVMRAKVLGTGAYFAPAVSFLLLLLSLPAFGADEQRLGELQVGDRTYENVTVRTKAKDYIFIVHSSGMTSIKVTQLPADVLGKLGYAPTAMPKRTTDAVAALTRTSIARGGVALVEGGEAKLLQAWRKTGPASKMQHLTTYPVLVVVAAVLLMAHLFGSYCCMLICRKTGNVPGFLVWVPLLQAVPMLRAASMSAWWFGGLFIPGLNLLGYVLWCVKIVKARQKTMPLAILLLFPLTSWFAFLFLALSEDSRDEGAKVHVETMTLATAWSLRSRTRVLLQSEQHIVA